MVNVVPNDILAFIMYISAYVFFFYFAIYDSSYFIYFIFYII